MMIKVDRWVFGAWKVVHTNVTKVTKTMIVVGRGHGTERFNRKSGWVVGHGSHGLAGMTDPSIRNEELKRFEAELKAQKG